jgi:putative chitinase
MTLTERQFAACLGTTLARAQVQMSSAVLAMDAFGITSPFAVTAFLANMGHETLGLVYAEEVWGPTSAQMRYEPPSDLATKLGNTAPGDGKRYRGRGPTQLTGASNYRRVGPDLKAALPHLAASVPDFHAQPDMAATPRWAWYIAAQFFKSRGCVQLAEAGDFDGVCKRINGGVNGLADRKQRYIAANTAIGIQP